MAEQHDDPRDMTPAELHDHLTRLGLSQAALGRLFGVDRGTPNHWLSGRVPVPAWAAIYLRALLDLRRVCATLPGLVPDRLQGLGLEVPAMLHKDNILPTEGIALNQQGSTMWGMDRSQPMQPEAFKAALKALGWTQSHFARAVGCTVPTASRWANGSPIPGWVPVVLGLLTDVQRLHERFVQPDGGKAGGGP
jgi:transcriptional regulator with XRE-family HTH domain